MTEYARHAHREMKCTPILLFRRTRVGQNEECTSNSERGLANEMTVDGECRQTVGGRRHATANVDIRKAISTDVDVVCTRIRSQVRWSRENNTVLYMLVYRFSPFSPYTNVFRLLCTTVETTVSSRQSRSPPTYTFKFQNVDKIDTQNILAVVMETHLPVKAIIR